MYGIRLIGTDMDGTFISNDVEHSVSTENRNAFKEAQALGVETIVISGRSNIQARNVLKKNNINSAMICANGALILDEDNNVLHKELLAVEQVTRAISWANTHSFYVELYTNKGHFTKSYADKQYFSKIVDIFIKSGRSLTEDYVIEYANRRVAEGSLTFVEDLNSVLDDIEIEYYKIFVIHYDEKLIKEFRNFLEEDASVIGTSSWYNNVEVTSALATKGKALAKYAELKGYSLDNTMVLGDNYNDVSMLEVAGLAIVMDNAPEDIKGRFPNITNRNDENGFAAALDKYVLKKEDAK